MFRRFFQGGLWIIRQFMIGTSRDLIIFDAEQTTDAGLVQVWLQVLIIEIEPDIAIKIAVIIIAGIAFNRAPNLLGRFAVAGQASDIATGRQNRSIDAEARTRFSEQYRVGVSEKIAKAGVFQQFFQARRVAALRQPDALWPTSEVALELPTANLNLRSLGILVADHQRQKAVRRPAGD